MIGDSASSIAEEKDAPHSSSSYRSNLDKIMKGRKQGKTRQEAFANLDIKKAELLSTGEIKLPNGKIIGHRDYRHIYRQRTRLPDQREAIVINKLALEYRRASAAEGGAVVLSTLKGRPTDAQYQDDMKGPMSRWKFIHRAERDHMQIGVKNSKTMMKHFRIANNI